MEPTTSPATNMLQAQLHTPAAAWAVAAPLLKWVGGNLASGIVGAAGGKIFTEVLNLIGLGGPDLAGKLDGISNQLSEVQRSLDRLTAMTGEILAQLSELKEFMTKSLKQQELSTALRQIETVYGAPTQDVLLTAPAAAISLHVLTVTLPKTPGITDARLQEAGNSFASYAAGMPYAINTIHDVLTDRAFGSESLLTYWAQELIREIRKGSLTQEQACQILEGYFLQAVSTQLKGVTAHCVALGAQGAASEALVRQYLTEGLKPKMRNQTRAYVHTIENILFATTKPTMPVAGGYGLGALREFPRRVDGLLLRADLLAAALNLSGTRGPALPLHEAIRGVYGRALFRPADLQNGPPEPLPLQGYLPQSGTDLYQTPLHCLSMSRPTPGALTVLQDVSTAFASVAHYFWPIDLKAIGSGVGVPIDHGQRDGVVPALYPVFGTGTPDVMAASFLDVTRLYRSVPPQVDQFYAHSPFSGNSYVNFKQQGMHPHRNPLTDHPDIVFHRDYQVDHIYKAEGNFASSTTYRLFRYQGQKARVRLTVYADHVLRGGPRLDCGSGTAFAQEWELVELLNIRRVGGPSHRFFDSRVSYPPENPMRMNTIVSSWRYPFPRAINGIYAAAFDLEPGEYELFYEEVAAFPEAPKKYTGWHSSGINFKIRQVTLELADPAS